MTHSPKLIIHGGAGRAMRDPSRADTIHDALHQTLSEVWDALTQGAAATEACVLGAKLLEDDPTFNAGRGSVLQSDGQIRLSAALMGSDLGAFSGVINVTRVQHPIALADHLQTQRDRVVAADGAAELARELGLPIFDPVTPRRLREWLGEYDDAFKADAAQVAAEHGTGTIGVVALDDRGHLAAATSTGGRGFERVGRVSDSATPAGNYADAHAAVSCTGIGEHILDASLASRLVVRVTDGMSLQQAMTRSMQECEARGHNLGAISIASDGTIGWCKTSDILLAAWRDNRQAGDTLSLPTGVVADTRAPA